jgi:hypothetical protein
METKFITIILIIGMINSCEKEDSINTLNKGLIAYYPFNGNANDKSFNGNNGTVFGATLTSDRNGIAKSAYYFDGISNYISVPDTSMLQITDQITMCAWIKTNYLNPYAGIINKINPSSPSMGYGMCSYTQGQLIGKIFWNHSEGIGAVIYSETQITDDVWHFIGFTYDGAIAKLFIDNEIIDSIEYTGGIQTNSEPLLIGWDKNSYLGDRHYQGIIDEVRIYNRALNISEITALYNLK